MNSDVVQYLAVDDIVSQTQVRRRFCEVDLAELAESIREVGVQQPIRVRQDGERWVVVLGERRLRAAKLAGQVTVPAFVIDGPMNETDVLQWQLIENAQRADVSPLEMAIAIHALMDKTGCTAAAAAKRIGKSAGTVSKLLALLDVDDDVKAKLESGELGLRAGYDLARQSVSSPAPTGDARKTTPPSHRFHKLTAPLGDGRSVSTTGVNSTMEAFLDAIESLVARAKAARKQGLELPTFLAMLRDQSGVAAFPCKNGPRFSNEKPEASDGIHVAEVCR